MKRFVFALACIVVASVPLGAKLPTQRASTSSQKPPCADSIGSCPVGGCGGDFDSKLNETKNIISVSGTPTPQSITWMQKLDNPDNFSQNDDRDEIISLGEGQNITVVAYITVIRKELGGESCNCGLHTEAETDNHMVVVPKSIVDQIPLNGATAAEINAVQKQREAHSTTAEFTPRVRNEAHPNFTYETVNPLIQATPQKALWVRITGQLMFDSEHFLHNHLDRVNNWEIHPVMKLEYCTTDFDCVIDNDRGWKSIDDIDDVKTDAAALKGALKLANQ